MNFLHQHSVLVLNSLWSIIGTLTPKKAMISLNSSFDGENVAARAIDIVYEQNEDGSFNLDKAINLVPLSFEDWIKVKPRPGLDRIIHTSKLEIRCPTVIISNYNKMPVKKFRPTKNVLYDMQDGICGYSGEKISHKQGSIEHKHPKSLGGKDTWENLLIVKKEINHKRGNKPLEELGLRPLFFHKEPKPLPVCVTIKKIMHPDWLFFLYK